MKTFIFTIFFSLALLSNLSAQTNCPTISASGPSGITHIGDSMTFTAQIEGIDLSKIKYEWIVSAGTITSGQNTSTIVVATNTDLAGMFITATVKISGLPQECKNEASASDEVLVKPLNIIWDTKVDEYGKIPWDDEKARFANVALALEDNNDFVAYFVMQTKGKNRSKIFKLREAKIKKYFFETYKIAKNRIRFIDGGIGDDNTEVHIMPIGAVPPQ